jgi:hypothetical protein
MKVYVHTAEVEDERAVDAAMSLKIEDDHHEYFIKNEDGHLVIDVLPRGAAQGVRYRVPPSQPIYKE